MQEDVIKAIVSGFSGVDGVEVERVSVFRIYADYLSAMLLILKCCENIFSLFREGVDSFKFAEVLEIPASKMPEDSPGCLDNPSSVTDH